MTLVWVLLVTGVLVLVASILFDSGDIGMSGGASLFSIGSFLVTVGSVASIGRGDPLWWMLAVPCGILVHHLAVRSEAALRNRADHKDGAS